MPLSQEVQNLNRIATDSTCAAHPGKRLTVGRLGGEYAVLCFSCDGPPKYTEKVQSETQKYLTGQPQSAAIYTNLDKKYGEQSMTEEQVTALATVRATPPDIMPTAEQALQLVKQFKGWTEPGKDIPVSAAVSIHALVNMGVMPLHISVLNGNPYVEVDGMIAHAQRVIEQRGQTWGRIVYTSDLTGDEYRRLKLPKTTDHAVSKATYQSRQLIHKKITKANGDVEEWDELQWFDEQSNVGSGNPSASNQPVERQHPARMAEARATRRMLKLMAGLVYPANVEIGMSDSNSGETQLIAEYEVLAAPSDSETTTTATVSEPEPSAFDALDEQPAVDEDTGEIEQPPAELTPRPDLLPDDPIVFLTVEGLKNAGLNAESLGHLAHRDATGNKAVMRMLIDGHAPMDIVDAALMAQPEGG